ncbi:MAG: 3-dehydroquinate synthase, partial [Roseovarius sp.]|nr:3-dehydroquinate synthase [Roseovarius sp.]
MTEIVHVGLPGREYDIHIGPGLLGQSGALIAPLLRRPRVAIVTDATVGPLHLATLCKGLEKNGIYSVSLTLPAG